jgi:hypothetical protein
MNKRGQSLSTSAIILIILGVVILVILILGFSMGWDKIAPWINNQNNVDTITQQCAIACNTGSVYDFCGMERTLKDGDTEILATCYTLSLDENLKKYGIETCFFDCKKSQSLKCSDWKYFKNGNSEEVTFEDKSKYCNQ